MRKDAVAHIFYKCFGTLCVEHSVAVLEYGCDYCVIETGLGGRLDATNTLNSIASVITPIELEHTSVLGDSVEKIAIEKSKIIKKVLEEQCLPTKELSEYVKQISFYEFKLANI